jgi:hypothetical protein
MGEGFVVTRARSKADSAAPKRPSRKDFQLFPGGFWKAPQASKDKVGDQSAGQIYLEVGHALSTWEGVEEILAHIFLIMCDVTTSQTAIALARTFGSIENSFGRLKAIQTVAEIYFAPYWEIPAVNRKFDAIYKNVSAAAQRRNEIAHGMAINFVIDNKDYGRFLIAPRYITGRNTTFSSYQFADDAGITSILTSKYCYTSSDIREMAEKFQSLQKEIMNYSEGLPRTEGSRIPKMVENLMKAHPKAFAEQQRR